MATSARDTAPSTRWTDIATRALFWLALLSLAALGVAMNRSPLPWVDETLIASGALSLARGGNGIPTFTGYPDLMVPFHWFYGPVYFELSGWAMRLFGESLTTYRVVSYASSLVLVVAVGLYAWTLSRSRTLMMLALAIVIFAPEFGSRATSGRMDNLGVGLLLAGAALYVMALDQAVRARAIAVTVAAAVVFALAMLTTPRCFPMAAGLAAGSLWALITRPAVRGRLLIQMLVFGATTLLVISAWTFSQGFSPIGWLHIIQSTSKGDTWNSSPVLGGSWNFHLSPPTLLGLLATAVAIPAAIWARWRAGALRLTPGETIVTAMTLVNALITVTLISRPFDYLMFWATPLLLTALVLSHEPARDVSTVDGPDRADARVVGGFPLYVTWLWLLIAAGGAALRLAKHVDTFATWDARDPRPVMSFVKNTVPPGSRVFGPHGAFFWATEMNGSQYISADGWAFVRREHLPEGFDPVKVLGPPPAPIPLNGGFLLWPEDESMPRELNCPGLTEVARFQPAEKRRVGVLDRFVSRRTGYPAAKLYRIDSCERVPRRL